MERSSDHIFEAFGTRSIGADLALPFLKQDKEYKKEDRAAWATLGYQQISALHNPANGFAAWCEYIEGDSRRIPVVQWTNDAQALQHQVARLASLGRGIILRFRKSQGWNLAQVAALASLPLGETHVLMVFDYEQILPNEDLTSIGITIQGAMLSASAVLNGGIREFVFIASSFPSEFKTTGEEHACLPIRERQLHQMLSGSPPLLNAGIVLRYGDHAAVFASERQPAFKGVPRVDYPTAIDWTYHRRREGFQDAATRVRFDQRWDETNLCWGAQRIREAAQGQMEGLNAAGKWTTVRMNIHMHVQAHSGGSPLGTDEPWTD